MRLVIVGAGRAGSSLAVAANRSGHTVEGVLTRSGTAEYGPALSWDEALPDSDVLLIAVKDDAAFTIKNWPRRQGRRGCVGIGLPVSSDISQPVSGKTIFKTPI